MNKCYQDIQKAISRSEKLLAVLIDPDKMQIERVSAFISRLNQSIATHIFVGGSEVENGVTERLVIEIKKYTELPVILFPGDVIQITNEADGILFLSLISGRNPDYLIGKHVESVSKLKATQLDVIPTGYLLIENGKMTSVERISQTKPIKRSALNTIINTAKAGEFLGMKMIYLETGSGATHPVEGEIIQKVKQELNIPLIVGGGIRSKEELNTAHEAGADLVVIGTAFEENEAFFNELRA